jgi:CHAD domain-containing protein
VKIGPAMLTRGEASDRLRRAAEAAPVDGDHGATTTPAESVAASELAGVIAAAADVRERFGQAMLPGGLDRPGRVRRLRIAARRLESLAVLFQDSMGKKTAKQTNRFARRLRRSLSELRSLDAVASVFAKGRVPGRAIEPDVSAWLQGWFAGERSRVLPATRRALDELPAIDSVWDRLIASTPHAGASPDGLLRGVCVEAMEREPVGTTLPKAEAIHDLRVGFKRVRFAMETLSPALAGGASLADRYAWVFTAQRSLGAVSDAVDCGVLVERAATTARDKGVGSLVRNLAETWPVRLVGVRRECWGWWLGHRAMVVAALAGEDIPGATGDFLDELQAEPPQATGLSTDADRFDELPGLALRPEPDAEAEVDRETRSRKQGA